MGTVKSLTEDTGRQEECRQAHDCTLLSVLCGAGRRLSKVTGGPQMRVEKG